jgi:hypothetical protein
MRKFSILTTLATIFALSVIVVSAASGEITLLANWLAAGEPVVTTLGATFKGSFKLEDTGTLFGNTTIECENVSFDENVGVNGVGEILKVLNFLGKEVEQGLKGEALLCEGLKGCERDASETEVWPVALPILPLVFLLETGAKFTIRYSKPGSKSVGWETKCLILGSLLEDTCTSESVQINLFNVTGGVELAGETEPGESCTEGNSSSGFTELVSGNLTTLNNGGPYTASSEGE